ncbi:glutamine--tRNA ligase/YqeY domain fusion protein [Paenibacillus sp. J5C_2022]|nr:glutamine--tRNA ligase/YqeY domain fusion protein [Paenibacillus sp. J5C2022]MCU6707260.1 glutamine--tRNA ligase/YqeY domain fusion protein [Paenibacillus sp. J5C2022]
MENKKHNEDYVYRVIAEELKKAPFDRDMCTRFPPEPNGYLHIGSAYAIHTNYRMAEQFNGAFHLRFDDTNPLKEDMSYVKAIQEDMKWLGYDPGEHIYFGSDYFEQIYDAAVSLIRKGKAYVCDLTPEEVSAYRGTLTEPGKDSPYRERTVEENLKLFEEMKNGRYPAASKVLRAKIDMSSPNMNMRDPVIYRIVYEPHYRTGTDWCVYPLYDFAHPIQDAIEGITYSLCSIEFKDHRPLYEWVLRKLSIPVPPRQREFGRLSLTGVVTSKRYLRQLVERGDVAGWDDPRLPTLQGLRRRGYTPESIRNFIEAIGSIRTHSTADISLLDHCLRQDLRLKTTSVMAVLRPLKVVITNYPVGETELLSIENNSQNEALGKREVPFSRTIYIERGDFQEQPEKGFHRLSPDSEVRLKGAYYVKCDEAVKDNVTDEVIELRCTYDPETKSGTGFTGRKVKGTIHWVSGQHAVYADVNLYHELLLKGGNGRLEGDDWLDRINPESLIQLKGVMLEPSAAHVAPEQKFQLIRHGYFCVDREYAAGDRLLFHRIVSLKDGWNRSN